MPYIFSTLSNDNAYTFYEDEGADKKSVPRGIHKVKRKILIKGGTAVVQSNEQKGIYTPYGVMTEVSNEDLNHLLGGLTVKEIMENPLEKHVHKGNAVFKKHLKNGFLRIDEKKIDIDKAVADLKKRDASAQKTEKDISETKGAAPVSHKK